MSYIIQDVKVDSINKVAGGLGLFLLFCFIFSFQQVKGILASVTVITESRGSCRGSILADG